MKQEQEHLSPSPQTVVSRREAALQTPKDPSEAQLKFSRNPKDPDLRISKPRLLHQQLELSLDGSFIAPPLEELLGYALQGWQLFRPPPTMLIEQLLKSLRVQEHKRE